MRILFPLLLDSIRICRGSELHGNTSTHVDITFGALYALQISPNPNQ